MSYKERFLYSKYNPSKSILQTIEKLTFLEDTLVLCCSPVLNYGLLELSKKLTNNSYLFLCEFDNELYKLQIEQIENIPNKTIRLTPQELYNLPIILQKINYKTTNGQTIPNPGTFKRVVRIDFSAGTQFFTSLYTNLQNACISSIKTFWTNRITLTKFGRKYSKNFFLNLKKLPETAPIENYFQTVTKPILLFGAGQSINSEIPKIKQNSKKYFIICVDTALSPLLKNNIIPDAVFIEEAQSVILKAFIGCMDKNIHIFAGLSSIPSLTHIFSPKQISFFTTLYTQANFITNLIYNNLVPPTNLPLGSVGLTALENAIKFRANNSVPILIFGLDFSYSIGTTHAKGTMAHIQRLISTYKLNPVENYPAAFGIGSKRISDKSNKNMITTPTLNNYALLFTELYSKKENVFDGTTTGIPLGLPFKNLDELKISSSNQNIQSSTVPNWSETNIKNFLKQEKSALEELRDILSGKITLSEEERSEKIKLIAEPREYLYLHFPDGHQFSLNISFLKRIRSEIDYFLKYL